MANPPIKYPKPTFPKLMGTPGLSQFPGHQRFGRMTPDNYTELLQQNGVPMKIVRAAACPNSRDLQMSTHPPDCDKCVNGLRFYGAQKFLGAFAGNSAQTNFGPEGQTLYDTAQIIIPTTDEKGQPINANFFDRIFVENDEARYFQVVQTDPSKNDRLAFPAKRVEILFDDSQEYAAGVDFQIDPRGQIEWLPGGRRPVYDVATESGGIFSIVYYSNPCFSVVSIPSAITTVPTPEGGQARLPYVVMCRRELIPFSDKQGLLSLQQPAEPRD